MSGPAIAARVKELTRPPTLSASVATSCWRTRVCIGGGGDLRWRNGRLRSDRCLSFLDSADLHSSVCRPHAAMSVTVTTTVLALASVRLCVGVGGEGAIAGPVTIQDLGNGPEDGGGGAMCPPCAAYPHLPTLV